MKNRLLSALLAGSLILGTLSSAFAAEVSDFADIPNDWSYAAVEYAISNDLLRGTNGKIDPQGQLTRAQVAAIISRAFGVKKQADLSQYVDVSSDAWYYADQGRAVQMGAMNGSEGRLNPDTPSHVSRRLPCWREHFI